MTEQVLAPRFEFKPKNPSSGPTPGFDYGEGGYDPAKWNVGFNEESGQFQIEIKGLAEPKSKEAARICQEDLNEVIAAFVQEKTTIERGIFDPELVPEELTQLRMGKGAPKSVGCCSPVGRGVEVRFSGDRRMVPHGFWCSHGCGVAPFGSRKPDPTSMWPQS